MTDCRHSTPLRILAACVAAFALVPAAALADGGKGDPLSKFEARHIRHSCRDKAQQRALSGAERETFLAKCFFGRASTRRVTRRECLQQGAAKGLEKSALDAFVRDCVKERHAHPKEETAK